MVCQSGETMPDYLCKNRHNDTYYFRFIVPSGLEPYFQKKVYRRTLSTKDKKTARIAARAARVAFDRILSEASLMSGGIPKTFTDEELIDYINEGIAHVKKTDPVLSASLSAEEAIEISDALYRKRQNQREKALAKIHNGFDGLAVKSEAKPDLIEATENQVRPKKSQSKKMPSYKLSQLVEERLKELEKANPNAPAGEKP